MVCSTRALIMLLQILELAQSGLQKRGFGEEVFLEPLFERAERLTNPALDYLNAIEQGTHIEELIEHYAALNTRILTGKEQL